MQGLCGWVASGMAQLPSGCSTLCRSIPESELVAKRRVIDAERWKMYYGEHLL